MNRKLVKASMLLIVVSGFFIAGCGPVDANEAQYLAQDGDASAQMQGPADEMKAPAKEGCPTGGCPTGGCATGQCDSPYEPSTERDVRLPDITKSEPVKVDNTYDRQDSTDTIRTHQTTHVYLPHEEHHVTEKHRKTINEFYPDTVYHPTTRRINSVVRTNSSESRVMPTVERTEPVVDYGCSDAVQPAPAPVVQPVVVAPVIARVRAIIPVLPLYSHLYRMWY